MQTLIHRKGKFNIERVQLRLYERVKRALLHKKMNSIDSKAMKRHVRRHKRFNASRTQIEQRIWPNKGIKGSEIYITGN